MYQLVIALEKNAPKHRKLNTLNEIVYYIYKNGGIVSGIQCSGAYPLMSTLSDIKYKKQGVYYTLTFSIMPNTINNLKKFLQVNVLILRKFLVRVE